jgi:signal transduction histidine kinase
MRDRLIAAFVGLTVLVVVLYGVPRAYLLADLVETQEQRTVERTLDLVEVVILDRQDRAVPVTPELLTSLLHEGEQLDYAPVDGGAVSAGDAGPPSTADLSATRVLPDGSQVTLTRSGALVSDKVSQALLPLVLIGLGLVLLSGLAAWWLSRRLASPFQDLAVSAQELGTGRFDLDLPHSSVPEAELIGTALRDSARRLEVLVRNEREFTVQASHLLRTPITALRLDLEDVALWPQTPPDVAAQLTEAIGELDRLSASITGLLASSQGHLRDRAEHFDLSAAVQDSVEHAEAGPDGPRLRYTPSGALPVRLPQHTVRQVVDALLEHLLTAGPGLVSVETLDRGTYLLVRMVRQDPRDVTGAATGQDELGAARGLVATLGGTLVLLASPQHGLELMLPREREPG